MPFKDYAVWSHLVKRIGTLPSKNVEVMKECANQAWDSLSKEYIEKVCSAFSGRLKRVIAANGGPIE